MSIQSQRTVAVCDMEPIAIEGIRSLLEQEAGLRLIGTETTAERGLAMLAQLKPAIVIIDKAFGLHTVAEWISRGAGASGGTSVVVWGTSIHSAEAVRFMQSGARGVIPKTSSLESVLECLRSVAGGQTWLEQSLLRDTERMPRSNRSSLTPREQEVLDLVEQGMRNKDIAEQLGIRPGTVKIHLKHIFEKTGIHGRYGLALNGLKEKGLLAKPPVLRF
jgi:two-component system nitrate/nitrite response regulator NarL